MFTQNKNNPRIFKIFTTLSPHDPHLKSAAVEKLFSMLQLSHNGPICPAAHVLFCGPPRQLLDALLHSIMSLD